MLLREKHNRRESDLTGNRSKRPIPVQIGLKQRKSPERSENRRLLPAYAYKKAPDDAGAFELLI